MSHQLIEGLESRILFTTYVVNTTADSVAADGLLSLREAVQAANSNAAVGDAPAGSTVGDVIRFAGSLHRSTINLTQGEMVINDDLQFRGGTLGITLDAGGNSRLLNVTSSEFVSISGLTFSHGAGVDGGAIVMQGGGATTISRCIFTNNTATNVGGAVYGTRQTLLIKNSQFSNNSSGSDGGAIESSRGSVTIRNSRIENNHAADLGLGGGINFLAFGSERLVVTNTRVINNTSEGNGGGIASQSAAGTEIRNCQISQNTATFFGSGGGGFAALDGSILITGTRFDHNRSSGEGGGAFASFLDTLTIRGSSFTDNVAGADGGPAAGGGLSVSNGTIVTQIKGSRFIGNTATSDGGGISNSAGVTQNPITISNTVIRSNASGRNGGGVFNSEPLTITGSTISQNTATASGGAGGGIYTGGVDNLLRNTIVTDNAASDAGGGIFTNSGGVSTLIHTIVKRNTPTDFGGQGTVQ
jgi:CSLREA domain-containing protein